MYCTQPLMGEDEEESACDMSRLPFGPSGVLQQWYEIVGGGLSLVLSIFGSMWRHVHQRLFLVGGGEW